jgi:two-component sensor histidine kinase
LALLNHAAQAFMSTLNLDEVISLVLDELRRLLGVVAYSVWLVDPKTKQVFCHQAAGPKSQIVRGWQLTQGAGIASWVAEQSQGLIVPDTRLDRRHFKEIDRQTQLEIRSILSVPLKVKQRVIGVLQMVDTQVNRFDAPDLALLESLAATAAIAIENARLYEQAQQDAQTKLNLFHEVNHRVKNNLAAIIGILYAERRHAGLKQEAVYQEIIKDLINRVQGLATVHNLLSAAEWAPLSLSELTEQVISNALRMVTPPKQVDVDITPSSIYVTPKQANHLALVINELVTNTVKHALAERDTVSITVRTGLEEMPDGPMIIFEFRDDGPAYPEGMPQPDAQHVGLYLIQTIVQHDLEGEVAFSNQGGAMTLIRFKKEITHV